MDPAERLADYLAGDLSADEAARLEAELARDAGLRSRLEALRRADDALARVGSPTPPDGFEERLRERLAAELEEQLGPQERAGGAAPAPVDEVAQRRERRSRRWVPALTGAAAGLALLAGAVVVIGNLATEDDLEVTMDTLDTDDAPEAAEPDLAPEAEGEPAPPDGPVVVARDRDLSADEAGLLLEAPALEALAGRALDDDAAVDAADRWREALGPAPPEVAEEAPDALDEPAEDRDAAPRPLVRLDGAVEPADLEDVDRCLAAIEDGPAIPAYVELLELDGEPAIAFGLVTRDPTTGAFTRTEVWIVGREDCQVRHFVQR